VAAVIVTAAILASGPSVLAHAQLVSSFPGAGQRVEQAPEQLTLIFSERLDPIGSGVDVLDSEGRLVASGGTIDPSDAHILHVALPHLADGLYNVNWHSLSTDDGHSVQGFFTFGVGEVAPPGLPDQPSADIHAGHSPGEAILETVARFLSGLGALLAFGLVVAVVAIVRPFGVGRTPLVAWAGLALLGGGLGSGLLLVLSAGWSNSALGDYATQTQPGVFLLLRGLVGICIGGIALAAVAQREKVAAGIVAAGGMAYATLLAASGHASAFGSPAPILMAFVHILAAGIWLGGVAVLAWLAIGDSGQHRELLGRAVPRFSAVALASVGLFSLSGLYLWWLMVRDVVDLDSSYGVLIGLKVVLGLAALSIGGLNYLGLLPTGRLGLHRRLLPEAMLGITVVAVTAVVTSGSPSGPLTPVRIEPAVSSAPTSLDASFGLIPAKPGPNRVHVTLPERVSSPVVSLQLDMHDLVSNSHTSLALQPLPDDPGGHSYAADVLVTAGSRWDATVVLIENGVEQARSRFVFAFDTQSLSAGRATSPINPLSIVGIALLGLAVLGIAFALGGGALPRTDPGLARRALLIGGSAAGAAGVAALLSSPIV